MGCCCFNLGNLVDLERNNAGESVRVVMKIASMVHVNSFKGGYGLGCFPKNAFRISRTI